MQFIKIIKKSIIADVRDYKKIMKEFGTMDDFDNLLSEIHNKKMKLVIDLVVN